MIGQTKLLQKIKTQIENDKFPRFAIIVGPEGSGKSLIARAIAHTLNAQPIFVTDVKVDAIKEVIQQAYKTTSKVVYIINHADTMSLSARNAILKVIEEPPNNATFVMTLEDINNTLPTIKSRGAVYQMDCYSRAELVAYWNKYPASEFKQQQMFFLSVCETPGDIDKIENAGPVEFYKWVVTVIDNIAVTSGSNVFKIAEKLSLKDEDAGYDLRLFWRAFECMCVQRYIETHDVKYLSGSKITRDALNLLRYKGVNRVMLVDKWILSIREEWL